VRTFLVLVAAAVLGAVDQYLGSFSAHPWMADVSLLSAPWLVLPFAAGLVGRSARGAALLGAGATFLALVGYGLMTLSPLENAHLSVDGVVAFLRAGNYRWFLAGAVTGPVLGFLAYVARARRIGPLAVAVCGLLCAEPVVHALRGVPIRSTAVAAGEVAAGVVLAVAAWWTARERRLTAREQA
jgi:hypothetical protein